MAIANTTIQIRKSLTGGNTPSSLANGEIAINQVDGKLYYRTPGGVINFITNQQTFSTVNANSSLILASSTTDTLSFAGINGITITGNNTSKTVTIDGNTIYTLANSAYALANAALANTGTTITVNGSSILSITNTTPSQCTTTGALVVSGGVGISGNVYTGGSLTAYGTGGISITTGSVSRNQWINTASISTTSPTTIDSWSTLLYRTAKYIVQMTQGTNFHVIELLVLQNSSALSANLVQYGEVFSNTSLGTFDVSVGLNTLNLTVTPYSNSTMIIYTSRDLISL